MSSVFVITSNKHHNPLIDGKFFSTVDLARTYLQELANERRYRLGVQDFKQEPDRFEFLLGWEEIKVVFQIVEITVADK